MDGSFAGFVRSCVIFEADILKRALQQAGQEAAFICLAGALDFGSGWRGELRAHHGLGPWQTAPLPISFSGRALGMNVLELCHYSCVTCLGLEP